MTVEDGSFKDVGNEGNNKNVPNRLPGGWLFFREGVIGKGIVPLSLLGVIP
jgi:hypothetical protein